MWMQEARVWLIGSLVVVFLSAALAQAQQPSAGGNAAPPPAAQVETPKDALGRDTPRATVLGFMAAARKDSEVAAVYLNTRLRGDEAADLAHKLFVVLDSRLPARLNELSDRPEGSMRNPLKPNQDVVGTITTANGPLDIIVERVTRGTQPPTWLFSSVTLQSIPEVFDEVDLVEVDQYLPGFLTGIHVGGVRLFEWLACLLVIPACYYVIGLLNALLRRSIALARRRRTPAAPPVNLLPGPVRLLLLAVTTRWLLSNFDLPLVERLFWSGAEAVLAIIAVGWLLLRLNAVGERYVNRRLGGPQTAEMVAVLRLVRRIADVLVIAAGGLVALHYFGVDPPPHLPASASAVSP